MKGKLLMILLISLSLLVAGCVDNTETTTEENASMNDSVNDSVNDTVNDTVADDVSVEENNSEDTTSEEDEKLVVTEYEGPKTYTVYMENFLVQPGNLTIAQYDTVVWFNRNNPTRLFTVVSNEELWDNTTIGYRLSFKYTFNETGTYTYYVLGWEERMKGTIIVK
ncbi:hypothetical protein RE474_00600 [Methanolobus sediminis]|uniref:Copper binding protein, plastocyanin/azurin family n=1 Tax=Methanolobus sediminis TaxID=3072978 RepID=A0AA51UKJ2_9EURY|nr:hypothetical protein [Methanolobus sediminis]WMW25251.1 hypothetical protein RE474_00600 [Methanolobus sediminis]